MWRHILQIFVLVMLFGGSLWLVRMQEEKEAETSGSPDHILPDHTMDDFVSVRIDETGQQTSRLRAKQLRHYPRRDTELVRPDLIFYANTRPGWHLRSETGRVTQSGDTAWFQGKAVFRHHAGDSDSPDLKVISRDVRVDVKEGYAETAAHTMMYTSDGHLEGTGMQFSAREQRMELLANVQGWHENVYVKILSH